jgi:hypothetical protein
VQVFKPYLRELRRLADSCSNPLDRDAIKDAVVAALDGKPGRELRRLASIGQLRKAGAFFTGATLSERLISPILPTLTANSVIADPACGAGDLLVACAKHLPLAKSGQETINLWSDQLIGRDLYKTFVDATKIRILLTALQRGAAFTPWDVDAESEKLHQVRRGSGLADDADLQTATHILLNPPFSMAPVPKECDWGGGSVNQAAIFLDTCVSSAQTGTHILAILPDVLRSGSRYRAWRRGIEKHATVERIGLNGQFDSWTDVHVFLLYLRKRSDRFFLTKAKGTGLKRSTSSGSRLQDLAEVCVGPVVPHRDPKSGPWRKFICARSASPWQVIRSIKRSRRFTGRVFDGPFVVVRRTSRPGDPYRAIASIVAVSKPVAVENHLLVLIPNAKTLANCRTIVELLRNERTNLWLDHRIRCRHLTVRSLGAIPDWRTSSPPENSQVSG